MAPDGHQMACDVFWLAPDVFWLAVWWTCPVALARRMAGGIGNDGKTPRSQREREYSPQNARVMAVAAVKATCPAVPARVVACYSPPAPPSISGAILCKDGGSLHPDSFKLLEILNSEFRMLNPEF